MKIALYKTVDDYPSIEVVLRFSEFNEKCETVERISEVIDVDFEMLNKEQEKVK